jgi:hypothetical protein
MSRSPVLGALSGVSVGFVVGGLGSLIVLVRVQSVHPDIAERTAKAMSIALIVLAVLAGLASYAPRFDDPASKYVSKGEYLHSFLWTVLLPGVILVAYVLVAGPPTKDDWLTGETSRSRRWLVRGLIALAALSSLYFFLKNIPHLRPTKID